MGYKDYLFSEAPRTLEDVDRLAQSMNYLSSKIGEEKAQEVESNPHEFFNANKFRYFQAKGYHRSIPFAFVTTLAGVFALGGYSSSNRILRTKFPFVFAFGFANFLVSQKFFEWRAGYRHEDYLTHTYAKYVIITRNLKIKQ